MIRRLEPRVLPGEKDVVPSADGRDAQDPLDDEGQFHRRLRGECCGEDPAHQESKLDFTAPDFRPAVLEGERLHRALSKCLVLVPDDGV